ncbi:ubiquinone anaerobic biosynthesis protein UbiV [Oricola nitratireducens]|uniref:ubiquinone anaerobic biosynthesis protein UbiV n=1 Tax=Oricola nitratireducens TaxID=2775868 RepID=UPI001AED8A58|nr:U32 family peptidase [Oricola nitratireducens]
MAKPQLTMGPVLFHWSAEQKRDFWFRVADEAPVDVAYLGEVICSKRTPFFDSHLPEVAERLIAGGKKVVWVTMAEVLSKLDRNTVSGMIVLEGAEIEANDSSALSRLSGRPHRIGQYFNVYNELAMEHLARNGACHFTLPVELPAGSFSTLAATAHKLGAGMEVQIFGRVGLALSARCYHARAHGRTKDNCLFVCENDPDGMDLKTHSGAPFLSINGIQTLSHRFLNLSREVGELKEIGVTAFRLSPHSCDMIAVSRLYRELLDERVTADETDNRLVELGVRQPMMNGFFHAKPGFERVAAHASGE